MKIKTHRDSMIDLIPETEEERLLLAILSKRDVGIANYGLKDGQITNLCLQFLEHKTGGKRQ